MHTAVDGVSVHFEERGEGAPILMVHGWSADHRYMLADMEPIFERRIGWRRVYPDLPGHGQTPAPGWLSDQDQMLRILVGFIDQVLGEEPVAIAGSSYGGLLTLGLVRAMPDRIRGSTFLEPDLPSADGSRDLPEPVTLFEDRSLFADLAPDEGWIPDALPVHEASMLEQIRAHDMPAYRAADRAFLERLEARYLFTQPPATEPCVHAGPSLILTGRQDATVGFRAAWNLLAEFPRATYAVLDLAGHHLGRIEQPELFRHLVAEWLDRLEREHGRPGGSRPSAS
jgi:pimeloyl-ACP methyl ester carboxylesterase